MRKHRHTKRLAILSAGLFIALLLQNTPVQAKEPADNAKVTEQAAVTSSENNSTNNAASTSGKAEASTSQQADSEEALNWTGWGVYANGARVYRTENGYASGLQEIDGNLYLFDENNHLRQDNAWVKYEGKYYFPKANGVLYRDQMITFGPKTAYYMDHDGSMATGFREVGTSLYYFDRKNGKLHKENSWLNTERGWVFPNAQGRIYRDQVITFGHHVAYYMDHDGSMATGFREVGTSLYYFDRKNGKLHKDNSWLNTERGWVFPNAQGRIYRDRVITFGYHVAYYMDHDGTIAKGFRTYNGKLMYFKENGIRANHNRFMETERGWIFPNAEGTVYRNQFITFGPKVAYYMGNDGVRKSGMILVNGTAYRMTGKNGARLCQEGFYSHNGKHYYADANGVPVRNREVSVNGVNYYYGADGARVFEDFDCDGYTYSIDNNTGAIQSKKANKPKAKNNDAPMLYSLRDLRFHGVINWGGYKFTYYSQSVLPGGGLRIPGRHVNESGYVADADGYIVLANSAPIGTIIPTPFGYYGKVYDRGTYGNHFDVYTR